MKMKYKNIVLLLLACVVASGFQACKSKKQIVHPVTLIENKENRELFADILANEFRFQTFTSKFNLNLATGTRSLSSKANLRMIKDKALQVSIQPLFGVEMFRLHVTPDSIILLDRMNKQYVQESIDDIKNAYPVGFDFETLQALFSNRLFVLGKQPLETSDYKNFEFKKASDMHYLLKTKNKKSAIESTFTVNGKDRVTFTHLIQPQKNYSLQWEYTDFVIMDGTNIYPSKMNISLESLRRKLNLGFNFTDTKINEKLEINISIPNGYKKIAISDIIKLLTAN